MIRTKEIKEAYKEINEIKQAIDELGHLNVKKKSDLVFIFYQFFISKLC